MVVENIKNFYKKYSRDEHTKEIIIGIAKLGFIVVLAVTAPNAAGHILKLFGMVPDYKSRNRTVRTLRSLKKRGLISYTETKGKIIIKLTSEGKQYYQRTMIESISLPRHSKWDGIWSIVTFDIPENKKINRRHFSKTLSILGMYNLEKSIFVYPYHCEEKIKEIADTFLVSKYVRYIRAIYLENDGQAKKFFKL